MFEKNLIINLSKYVAKIDEALWTCENSTWIFWLVQNDHVFPCLKKIGCLRVCVCVCVFWTEFEHSFFFLQFKNNLQFWCTHWFDLFFSA